MKKYKWSTYKIVQETVDCITLYFNTNQQEFSYHPGQYLNISCEINDELVMRSYSFSSKPGDEFPSITIKRVSGGKMSNYLLDNAAAIGDWQVEGPFGNFVMDTQAIGTAPIVLLGGGSGISPLFSMLKHLDVGTNTPLLIYGNRSPEESIFLEELEAIQAAGHLKAFYSFTKDTFVSQKTNHIAGRFSAVILRAIIKNQIPVLTDAHYYICGPVGLMKLYQEALIALHIPAEQIHSEYFDPNSLTVELAETDGVVKDVLVNYFQDYYLDNELQTYECSLLIEVKAKQTILAAMKEHHLQVQSSCMNGSCGTCWAVKSAGNVQMLKNQALTDADMAEGIVLLCQSYPLDQDVVISLS